MRRGGETLEVVRSILRCRVLSQYHKYVVNGPSLVGPVANTSNSPQSLGPYPVDGRRRVRSEDEWDSPVYTCCVVGSSCLMGVVSDQVDCGGDHSVVRVMARLQLATARSCLPRLWRWREIWMISCLRRRLHGPRREDRPRISS